MLQIVKETMKEWKLTELKNTNIMRLESGFSSRAQDSLFIYLLFEVNYIVGLRN